MSELLQSEACAVRVDLREGLQLLETQDNLLIAGSGDLEIVVDRFGLRRGVGDLLSDVQEVRANDFETRDDLVNSAHGRIDLFNNFRVHLALARVVDVALAINQSLNLLQELVHVHLSHHTFFWRFVRAQILVQILVAHLTN